MVLADVLRVTGIRAGLSIPAVTAVLLSTLNAGSAIQGKRDIHLPRPRNHCLYLPAHLSYINLLTLIVLAALPAASSVLKVHPSLLILPGCSHQTFRWRCSSSFAPALPSLFRLAASIFSQLLLTTLCSLICLTSSWPETNTVDTVPVICWIIRVMPGNLRIHPVQIVDLSRQRWRSRSYFGSRHRGVLWHALGVLECETL